MSVHIGIDVAKHELVACLLDGKKKPVVKSFQNSPSGQAALAVWASKGRDRSELRFCMESTGIYHEEAAVFLTEEGLFASVVEPRRIKHFGIGMGMKNKTDKADSLVIARYSQVHEPDRWVLSDPVRREIRALTTRIRQLVKLTNQESNREENARLPECVLRQIRENTERFQEQIRELEARIQELLPSSPQIQTVVAALVKVKGIGLKTALAYAVRIDPEAVPCAKTVGAFAGLAPSLRQSGLWQGRSRISKCGDASFRSAFYFSTIIAMREIPAVKAFAERLTAKGLKPKQVIAACMRKLLMILHGIAKNALKGKPIYGIPGA